MSDHANFFTATDQEREQRIRERAYHLWEADGRPHGGETEYWERAQELIGMEESAGAGLLPNPQAEGRDPTAPERVDEASIQDNYGEVPGLADQGEDQQTPMPRKRARKRA
jgi:hypothetical protein